MKIIFDNKSNSIKQSKTIKEDLTQKRFEVNVIGDVRGYAYIQTEDNTSKVIIEADSLEQAQETADVIIESTLKYNLKEITQ